MTRADFIVIDTEGKPIISEIAIINSQGNLIYEAYNQEYSDRYAQNYHLVPLKQILLDLLGFSHHKILVCHYAEHDYQIIKNSWQQVGITGQKLQFDCTYLRAKQKFPDLASYSLEYLSNKLNIKVNKRYFDPKQAHAARYDAAFTYELYRYLQQSQPQSSLMNQPNPFSSSRVDNPFQTHPDLASINQEQFQDLTSIITDIKYDPNHQSKGAVVIGEPGTGKTHLMMRLAQELLENNRLLFIRQPNNAETIIYHTYSRILESLVEKVARTNYTQLEYLLAHSFTQLINQQAVPNLTQKDKYIIQNTTNNPLNLYPALGIEGTAKKREYWQHIEKRTTDWWLNTYGAAGYSLEIVKGIIKFCSYSDPRYKRLVTRWLAADTLEPEETAQISLNNWSEETSKEAFSLEAISVLSKLSLLDKPLIIIFDQLEGLGLEHNRNILLNFGEAIKEIFTHVPNSLIILNLFPDRWQQFQGIFDGSIIDRISQHQVILDKLSPDQLKQILEVKTQDLGTSIDKIFSPQELKIITQQNSIRAALNKAYSFYRSRRQFTTTQTPKSETTSELTTSTRLTALEAQVTRLNQLFVSIATAFSSFQAPATQNPDNQTLTNQTRQNTNPEIEPPASPTENNSQQQVIADYLQNKRSQLEAKYDSLQIIDDNDDLGKLKTIVTAFAITNSLETEHLRLGKKKIPEHLVIRTKGTNVCLGFLQISGSNFTHRIKNFNSLVIANPATKFVLWRDARLPAHSGKVGKEEILKLKNAENGNFYHMDRANRINFELVYQLIIDIQNQDLDISLEEALPLVYDYFSEYWLVKLLT